MWVADRDGRELEPLPVDVEHLRAADIDRSEVDLDIVPLHAGRDRSLTEAHAWECDSAPVSKPHRRDPSSVPGQLRTGSVRIPDDDVGLGSPDVDDLEDTVGPDAVMGIAEVPCILGGERLCEVGPLDEQVCVT